jgi:hypothetical protein
MYSREQYAAGFLAALRRRIVFRVAEALASLLAHTADGRARLAGRVYRP